MITDLAEVARLSGEKQAENLAFRRYLKAHHCSEALFHIIAAEVEKRVDCRQCANCCHDVEVPITPEEIARIAAFLGSRVEDVVRLYTIEGRILKSLDGPCVFLDGKSCMIYDARPQPCREYPHSELQRRTLGGRMSSQARRASVCPIVFNSLEEWKARMGYRSK